MSFYKIIRTTHKETAGLILSGNISDVINTLNNLAFIFKGRSLISTTQQEFAEAEKAIRAVKICAFETKLRRRL